MNYTPMTQAGALKEMRLEAKINGLTFKKQNATFNGSPLYQLTDRLTGEQKASNYSFWSAYEAMQNGDFERIAA